MTSTVPEFTRPAGLGRVTEAPAIWRGALPSAVAATRVRSGKCGHRLIVAALLAMVIALDQATKWWAWRHIASAEINPGGDFLVGPVVGRWYSGRVTGAALDLLGFGLLSTAVWVLARRSRPALVVATGALMLGGWGSNLLDRLGMHYVTAPGGVRGAVDFIPIDGAHYYCNVADFFIVGATPLLLLAVGFRCRRAADRPATARTAASRYQLPARARVPALAVGGNTVVAVALGAANYGTVIYAPQHVGTRSGGMPARSSPPGARFRQNRLRSSSCIAPCQSQDGQSQGCHDAAKGRRYA
jgi:lipoprotein signal peptidase